MSIISIFHKVMANNEQSGKMQNAEAISPSSVLAKFAHCDDLQTRKVRPVGCDFYIHCVWLDGVCSDTAIGDNIIRPLMLPNGLSSPNPARFFEHVKSGGIVSASMKEAKTLNEVCSAILFGSCAVLCDGMAYALTFEVKTSNFRSVSGPEMEKTVKGSKDAFVETLRVNTSLVRRHIRSSELKMREVSIGRRSGTKLTIIYMENLTSPELVAAIEKRLGSIDIDGLITLGNLEPYIVDCPASPFPQLIHTERPDRFCTELLAGRAGLLVDGLPMGLIVPVSMSCFMRVGEDRSQHYLTASVILLVRWLSLCLAAALPAFFVALATYHQEMIPLKLLLSMVRAKQDVPFSPAVEVLAMLSAFELLHEAGMRMPSPVGDTVSIIGALIVGQSAVEAKVVSPIAVIVVATAGVCSFAQPSQDLGAALRLIRVGLVGLVWLLGMFGFMLGFCLVLWHLCTLESFGVSYVAVLGDRGFFPALLAFVQKPMRSAKSRPPELNPQDRRNQA